MIRICSLLSLLAGLTLSIGAVEQAEPPAEGDRPIAEVSATHQGFEQPSRVEVRLEPAGAAQDGELFVALSKGDHRYRRVLQPVERGLYRLEYTFAEAGSWRLYVRFGPGQAGFAGRASVPINPLGGGTDVIILPLEGGYSGDVPAYVQPLGFAAFGVITLTSLSGIYLLLGWIRRRLEAALPQDGYRRDDGPWRVPCRQPLA